MTVGEMPSGQFAFDNLQSNGSKYDESTIGSLCGQLVTILPHINCGGKLEQIIQMVVGDLELRSSVSSSVVHLAPLALVKYLPDPRLAMLQAFVASKFQRPPITLDISIPISVGS